MRPPGCFSLAFTLAGTHIVIETGSGFGGTPSAGVILLGCREPGEVAMMITVNDEERAELQKLLEAALRELRTEVRHTHDSEMRRYLKHRENILRRIGARVEVSAPAVVNV